MYQNKLKFDNVTRIVIIFIISGCVILAGELRNSWVQMHDSKAKVLRLLILNDVIYLSKKKEELSWGDFEKYQYKEGGSGLYIRYYEIETQWKLFIGGGDLKEKPLYITLENSITGDGFDIRENDAELMINRIKNGCE